MEKDNKNWFVRVLIILYVLILTVLVIISFFKGQPPFQLNSGIITVMLLSIVLVLSESFDNLSLGKILTLNRKIKNKNKEILEVKKENFELRENIITITSNINQTQSNNTFNGFDSRVLKEMLGVTKAKDDKDDSEEEFTEEEIFKDKKAKKSESEDKRNTNRIRRRKHRIFAEKEAIEKYIEKHNISKEKVISNAVFSNAFQDMDPIMEGSYGARFDAYIDLPNKEIFIEVKRSNYINPIIYNRLYVMLSKISFYRKAKEIRANMVLILVNIPEIDNERSEVRDIPDHENLIQKFQPAISNDLLRIEKFNFTEEDLKRWDYKIESEIN